MTYNPERNYCGPERFRWMRFPRRFFGVDINPVCYAHDDGWADGSHTKSDREFWAGLFVSFYQRAEESNRPLTATAWVVLGLIVSWIGYSMVRVGRLVKWIKKRLE